MTNQLSFPLGLLQIEQAQDMEILTTVPSGDKGKIKFGEELPLVNPQVTTSKKSRVVKDPFIQVVEYPTPTMEIEKGKVINTEKAILEHYSSLNMQEEKERDTTQEQLRVTQPQQLVTALDKKSQVMKVDVIQCPVRGETPNKKITKFKLNMSQFSVVDKVDFFKQTSELIFSNLITNSASKDKLYRDYKKLENKLRTEAAEKKPVQIKKAKIDKKILEQNKETGSNNMTLFLQERDTKILNPKKKMKIPNDGHLQTTELKTVLEEKESLQKQLLDNKVTIATFIEHKKVLEDKIKILKEQVDQISSSDLDFSLDTMLGKLSVKDLELKKMQDELHLDKQEVQEKHKFIIEALVDRDRMQEHVDSAKKALIEAKTII